MTFAFNRSVPVSLHGNASKDCDNLADEEETDTERYQDDQTCAKSNSKRGYAVCTITKHAVIENEYRYLRRPDRTFVSDLGEIEPLYIISMEIVSQEINDTNKQSP